MSLISTSGARCQKIPFQAGEKLTYSLWYNLGFLWLSVGNAYFDVTEGNHAGHPTYILTASGGTGPSYDKIFSVRDTLRSEVDPNTLFPFWGNKHAHEGKWHGNDEFSYQRVMVGEGDTAALGWKINTRLKRKGVYTSDVTEFTTNDGFDIITSVYRLRCIPEEELLAANPMVIPMRLDDGEYTINLYYIGDETIKLHKGEKWDCHLFHMTLVEGTVFKKGDYMKIWLAKGEDCMPVQIEAPIILGSVKGIFKEASGIKH